MEGIINEIAKELDTGEVNKFPKKNNSRNQTENKGGRPKGTYNKPQIRDYVNATDIRRIVIIAKQKAKEGDVNLIRFLLEQIFGKAPQTIDATMTLSFNLVDILTQARLLKEHNESNGSISGRIYSESNQIHSGNMESLPATSQSGI